MSVRDCLWVCADCTYVLVPGCLSSRYIPTRTSSSFARRCLFSTPRKLVKSDSETSMDPPKAEALTYQSALQNELLGRNITEVPDPQSVERGKPLNELTTALSRERVLQYRSATSRIDPFAPYSISPLSKSKYVCYIFTYCTLILTSEIFH